MFANLFTLELSEPLTAELTSLLSFGFYLGFDFSPDSVSVNLFLLLGDLDILQLVLQVDILSPELSDFILSSEECCASLVVFLGPSIPDPGACC